MSENEVKTKVEEHILCPHCQKGIVFLLKEETIQPAEKAVKEKSIEVRKDEQTTLEVVINGKTKKRK